jgi:thiol-disulfide isomerase/thioredoxin
MTRVLASIVCLTFALPAPADDAKPKGGPAADLLSAAQAEAKADGKAVFLAFGSPTCGWCKHLDKFHARPAVEKVLGRHLVFVKVDVVDNPGGEDLYKKYATHGGGVPVWVVLSADGKVLADSYEGGTKNVGFPYEPGEVAHYEKVMRAAVPKLTDGEVAVLMKELREAGPKK